MSLEKIKKIFSLIFRLKIHNNVNYSLTLWEIVTLFRDLSPQYTYVHLLKFVRYFFYCWTETVWPVSLISRFHFKLNWPFVHVLSSYLTYQPSYLAVFFQDCTIVLKLCMLCFNWLTSQIARELLKLSFALFIRLYRISREVFALQEAGCIRIYMTLHEHQIKGLVNPTGCLIGLLCVGFKTDALFPVQRACVYLCPVAGC